MRHLLLTLLICLLAAHTRALASDPAAEAATHVQEPLETSTTRESEGALPSADNGDSCEYINELQLGYCLADKAERAESELNRTYNEIMASLDKDRQNTLMKEERVWIKWREVECARQVKDVEDCIHGCGVPQTMHVVCMTNEARNRVQQLKSQWHR